MPGLKRLKRYKLFILKKPLTVYEWFVCADRRLQENVSLSVFLRRFRCLYLSFAEAGFTAIRLASTMVRKLSLLAKVKVTAGWLLLELEVIAVTFATF